MKNLYVLLQRFADAKLDYVVVDGFTGVLHGSAYVTEDLDPVRLVRRLVSRG
jgi:molybdopterin-guanine dinucleotide biosynthesis protein